MPEEKPDDTKVSAQIQGGFYPQTAPLMKGATMSEEKKGKIDEGFVPPGPPLKPGDKDDKGFVPPPPPRKPPDKPESGKK
jgi:hypothetical protein